MNRCFLVRTLILPGLLLAASMATTVGGTSQAPTGPAGPVGKDPRFDTLVPPTAKLERLADGFRWSEGPVWNRKTGALLFSDVPNNVVHRWREGEGLSEFLRPSGYTGSETFTGREPGSNGLTFDAKGRLVLCQHGDRRVARMDAPGRFTTLADRYEGKRLNSPNDLAYKSNGDLYFTDPPYGLPETFKDPRRELDFNGVYRLAANGRLTLLVRDLRAPNGIAFSPDERTLYVAQSDPERPIIMAYPVNGDGTLGDGRVLIDTIGEAKAGKPGLPDGLKVDEKGNLFATGPGGVLVIAPDGTHLGTIETGVPTANVAWGDDGSVLYITANNILYRIRTATKGRMP
jgi:gluconolactonase